MIEAIIGISCLLWAVVVLVEMSADTSEIALAILRGEK